jgi:hypothetical protein
MPATLTECLGVSGMLRFPPVGLCATLALV